ncbi:membrane protein [Nocardiopsis terrae]|uniref:Phage shock protein PspC (Stress-responsive transcriptional regulator) n=1 Tax=Nocardiopsis terrae TaxID=372655 RepID=A0ABR9HM09_9ACTN|nr:PspC domain-containing protein [Nocardiopsis terrae]MBE1460057.1 phage shock protein PspC (stress-responsive transcriptional regulator) [Nocardiopsis terrae]GHC69474.1 membrane protein [Nocardiopsis terrae]
MTDGEEPTGPAGGDGPVSGASAADVPGGAVGAELRRDDDQRALAGVCAGLGAYTRIDPVVWRAAFVLTAFGGGAGLVLYTAAWMLMRDPQGGPATFEQMLNRGIPPHAVLKLLTVGLAGATALSLVGGFSWGTMVLAIPLVLGLLTARNRGVDLRASLLALRSDLAAHEPPPAGPVPQPVPAYYNPAQPWASAPQGPVDLAVVSERTSLGEEDGGEDEPDDGAEDGGGGTRGGCGERGERGPGRSPLASHALWTVVAMAVVWAFSAPHLGPPLSGASTAELLFGPEFGVYFTAAAVAVVGLFSLVGTWIGNPRGLMFLGCLAVAAAVLVASIDVTGPRYGERTWQPATLAEADSEDLRLHVGAGTLDLGDLASGLPPGEAVDVAVRVDAGELVLVVPEGARTNVTSRVGLGAIESPSPEGGSGERHGWSLDYEETFEPTAPPGSAGDGGDPAESAGNEETEESAEGSGDDTDQDGVPVINVRTDVMVGKVEVRHGQAQN